MSKKKKHQQIKHTNMADNIEAMSSLMELFENEMYTIYHLITMLGSCYYVDYNEKTYNKAFLMIEVDEEENANVYCSFGDIAFAIEPIQVMYNIVKTEEEAKELTSEKWYQ